MSRILYIFRDMLCILSKKRPKALGDDKVKRIFSRKNVFFCNTESDCGLRGTVYNGNGKSMPICGSIQLSCLASRT